MRIDIMVPAVIRPRLFRLDSFRRCEATFAQSARIAAAGLSLMIKVLRLIDRRCTFIIAGHRDALMPLHRLPVNRPHFASVGPRFTKVPTHARLNARSAAVASSLV